MDLRESTLKTTIGLFLASIILVLILPSAASCTPPDSGDWVISSRCDVTQNVYPPEDVIVESTGILNISTTQSGSSSSTTTTASQSEWNQGVFDSTTVDRPLDIGKLALGYLDGDSPSATSLENGLKGYWRFDDVNSFSWETMEDFDQYSSNTDFRSNYDDQEDSYDLTTTYTAPGSSQAIVQTNTYDDLGADYVANSEFETPPGYYYSAHFLMTDSTDGPAFLLGVQDSANAGDDSYEIRPDIDADEFAMYTNGGSGSDSEAYTFSTDQWYRIEAKFTSSTVEARLYEVSSDGSETQVAGPISIGTDSNLDDGGFGVYGGGATGTYIDKIEKKQIGDKVTDYSGEANDGVNRGAATGFQGVFDTNAFDFDGSDDYVSVDSSYFASTTTMTDKFTVSFWAKPQDDGDGNVDGMIAVKEEINEDNTGSMQLEMQNNYIELGRNNDAEVVSASELSLDTWNHVAVVFDGANQEVDFYIDGSLDTTRSTSFSSFSYTNPIFMIGRRGFANDINFDGTLDEIRVYDRTLSSSEVTDLYLSGADGTFNGDYTSQKVDNDAETDWQDIEVDASIPTNTDASIEFEALDSGGSVVDSETFTLSGGTNNYTLSVSNSEDARWIVSGTSTDEEASWEVNDVTVYQAGTGGGGDPVRLNLDLTQYYLEVKAGGKVLTDKVSKIDYVEAVIDIITNSASNVGGTSATVEGQLGTIENVNSVDAWFDYGQGSFTQTTSNTTLSSTGTYTQDLTGLSSCTQYQFRASAIAADGTQDTGNSNTFTTASVPSGWTKIDLFDSYTDTADFRNSWSGGNPSDFDLDTTNSLAPECSTQSVEATTDLTDIFGSEPVHDAPTGKRYSTYVELKGTDAASGPSINPDADSNWWVALVDAGFGEFGIWCFTGSGSGSGEVTVNAPISANNLYRVEIEYTSSSIRGYLYDAESSSSFGQGETLVADTGEVTSSSDCSFGDGKVGLSEIGFGDTGRYDFYLKQDLN